MAAAHLRITNVEDEVLFDGDVTSVAVGHETVTWVEKVGTASFDNHSVELWSVKELVIMPVQHGHAH